MSDKALFTLREDFTPAGDQPAAIAQLAAQLDDGNRHVVLHGATGTGKSATTACLIARMNRPALLIAPNKTLAAQLAAELRDLLPGAAVEYFVSYFDYYQPEAYIASSDTFIEKDSSRNSDVERARHAATAALLTRRDVVVVASVSCIYGLGSPQEYLERALRLAAGDTHSPDELCRTLVAMHYERNDIALMRGTFRRRGDTIDIVPPGEERLIRIELFGDDIDAISYRDLTTGNKIEDVQTLLLPPASHYVAGDERTAAALTTIRAELDDRIRFFQQQNRLLEAQRLKMRTDNDLEMLEQTGVCSGIENYSLHFDGRAPGTAPSTLLDYFPDDFLTIIDESHVTVPQIGAMYEGDRSRKSQLIEFGFRLPSAADNRPLRWEEFWERVDQTVHLSATPGAFETTQLVTQGIEPVEQIIRPTHLVDPIIEVRPTQHQIDDLLSAIRTRNDTGERTLVTVLTKSMAEQLTDYLAEAGIKVRYLHSDVETLERIALLRDLRAGVFDVLVGINLLREGLDLPEVSLVAILDADKEGFLRSATSLIQTVGRAARNINGTVYMYADKVTAAMQTAIDETSRRRQIQIEYNTAHGITPTPLNKKIATVLAGLRDEPDPVATTDRSRPVRQQTGADLRATLVGEAGRIETAMHAAAKELKFEAAAALRDELREVRRELAALDAG